MKNIDNLKLKSHSTIRESLSIIDHGAIKIALVVNQEGKLIGTLSDGDLRRGFLEGATLEGTIEEYFNRSPVVATVNESKTSIINKCKKHKIYQIPVVNGEGIPVSIDVLDDLIKPKIQSNKVVLMVGGLGSRLRPLTENTPKPMLHVGGKPILQTIIENFTQYGFVNFVMCLNYQSQVIQDYFGDGSKFGINIEYVLENKRMGTAGAITLLKDPPTEPFFVMNGDLLTNVNFEHFLEFHNSNNSKATMSVRMYDFQVPYGVVKIKNGEIQTIKEKPIQEFFVNAGIYILDPSCIGHIPKNEYFDMPKLFNVLLADHKIMSFPLREYWLDIGQIEEFEKANKDFNKVFNVK